jgi:hypothetical protein
LAICHFHVPFAIWPITIGVSANRRSPGRRNVEAETTDTDERGNGAIVQWPNGQMAKWPKWQMGNGKWKWQMVNGK